MNVTWSMPQARRTGGARRLLRWALIVMLAAALMAAALGVALWQGLAHWTDAAGAGVSVTVNGQDVLRAWDITDWPPAHKVVLVAVIAVTLVAAVLAVPMALLAGSVALVLVVLGAVALPLLIALLIALPIMLSVIAPLVLLVVWLVRRIGPPPAQRDDARRTLDA